MGRLALLLAALGFGAVLGTATEELAAFQVVEEPSFYGVELIRLSPTAPLPQLWENFTMEAVLFFEKALSELTALDQNVPPLSLRSAIEAFLEAETPALSRPWVNEAVRFTVCNNKPMPELGPCIEAGRQYDSNVLTAPIVLPSLGAKPRELRVSDIAPRSCVLTWQPPQERTFLNSTVAAYNLTFWTDVHWDQADFASEGGSGTDALQTLDQSAFTQQVGWEFIVPPSITAFDSYLEGSSEFFEPFQPYIARLEGLQAFGEGMDNTLSTIFVTSEAPMLTPGTLSAVPNGDQTPGRAQLVLRYSLTTARVTRVIYTAVDQETGEITTASVGIAHYSNGGFLFVADLPRDYVFYNISATPWTTFGVGAGAWLLLRSPTNVPGPVQSVYDKVGQTITLNWEPPELPRGVVLDYTVLVAGPTPNDDPVAYRIVSTNVTSALLPASLAPPALLGVVARTSRGLGELQEPILQLGPPTQPPGKSKLKVTGGAIGGIVAGMVAILLLGAFIVASGNKTKDNFPYPEPDENTIPRNKITFGQPLGSGEFGVIFEGVGVFGKSKTEDGKQKRLNVAIKLCSKPSHAAKRDFIDEALIMAKFAAKPHRNVVRLLGYNLAADPMFIVLELCPEGDLQQYLETCAPTENNSCLLSTPEMVQMGHDIAQGMAHLESNFKFVHRDLAARNCLVSDYPELIVKISDFGMSREVHSKSGHEYYRKTGEALLPVRWMAPESLIEGLFSTSTDVYTFGVVLWEIFSYGAPPYTELTNSQVYEAVTARHELLPQPRDCPAELYNLMKECWSLDASKRPPFLDIGTRIYGITNGFQRHDREDAHKYHGPDRAREPHSGKLPYARLKVGNKSSEPAVAGQSRASVAASEQGAPPSAESMV